MKITVLIYQSIILTLSILTIIGSLYTIQDDYNYAVTIFIVGLIQLIFTSITIAYVFKWGK
jgi:hypothetical protein